MSTRTCQDNKYRAQYLHIKIQQLPETVTEKDRELLQASNYIHPLTTNSNKYQRVENVREQ